MKIINRKNIEDYALNTYFQRINNEIEFIIKCLHCNHFIKIGTSAAVDTGAVFSPQMDSRASRSAHHQKSHALHCSATVEQLTALHLGKKRWGQLLQEMQPLLFLSRRAKSGRRHHLLTRSHTLSALKQPPSCDILHWSTTLFRTARTSCNTYVHGSVGPPIILSNLSEIVWYMPGGVL